MAILQVQALAQATIQELHDKLAARSAQLEEVQGNLASARGTAASEVASLQRQLHQLTQLAQQQEQQHLQVSLHCVLPWACQSYTDNDLSHDCCKCAL